MIEGFVEKGRPPYVEFKREPVEDPKATKEEGRCVMREVDFAYITPPGTKDRMIRRVNEWFAQKEIDVQNGRFNPEWLDHYKKAYKAWKDGQELPLQGVPIRGWGLISAAKQEECIRANIRTVEDLAAATSDTLRMLGPQSIDLKYKAEAWLKELREKGGNSQEIAALRQENAGLKTALESLQRQVSALANAEPEMRAENIAVSEILDDVRAEYEKKFGKPPHHLMKEATIRAKLQEA